MESSHLVERLALRARSGTDSRQPAYLSTSSILGDQLEMPLGTVFSSHLPQLGLTLSFLEPCDLGSVPGVSTF